MNKQELIKAIAVDTGLKKIDAENFLNSFVDIVETTVANGEKVSLIGFGNFERRARAARKGINPQTQAEIIIAASNAPVFKAGKNFKELVKITE